MRDDVSAADRTSGSSSTTNIPRGGRHSRNKKSNGSGNFFRDAVQIVPRTPYPKILTQTLTEYDEYRNSINYVFGALTNLIQSDNLFRGCTGTVALFTPPDGREPHAQLHDILEKKPFGKLEKEAVLNKELEECTTAVFKLSQERNRFFAMAEKKMTRMIFFIYKFSIEFEDARGSMEKARDNVDSAKMAMKKAGKSGIDAAKKALEVAVDEYRKAVHAVMSHAASLPEMKKVHYCELEDVISLIVDHQKSMANCLAAVPNPKDDLLKQIATEIEERKLQPAPDRKKK